MVRRKNLTGFWGKFKDRIIDLFKEEEDKTFNRFEIIINCLKKILLTQSTTVPKIQGL
jgi:hypothetical protein